MKNIPQQTKEEYNAMRPKNGKLARTHVLSKIHKEYSNIPYFRFLVDSTGTPHYSVGKFLTNLLNPLSMNKLMQLIKLKIYHLILFFLLWNLYSQMFLSKEP